MAPLQQHSSQTLAYKSDIKWYSRESGRDGPLNALQQCVKILDGSTVIRLEWLLLIVFWNEDHSAIPKVPLCRAKTERWEKYRWRLSRTVVGRDNRKGKDARWYFERCKATVRGIGCTSGGAKSSKSTVFIERIGKRVFIGRRNMEFLKFFEYLDNQILRKAFILEINSNLNF